MHMPIHAIKMVSSLNGPSMHVCVNSVIPRSPGQWLIKFEMKWSPFWHIIYIYIYIYIYIIYIVYGLGEHVL